MEMFVCVRARDGRPKLVQLTWKFACTNWFGSGRVQHFTFFNGLGRVALLVGRVGSEKSDPPSTLYQTGCDES
jgi:hypothetical protein